MTRLWPPGRLRSADNTNSGRAKLATNSAEDSRRSSARMSSRGPRICRCRNRKTRDVGEEVGEATQHPVFRPEVVAPLADAVGFVDGDQGQWRSREPLQHPGLHQPLGRRVEDVELAGFDAPPGLGLFFRVDVGIEPGRRHTRLLQARNLVGHQGDERRHHQSQARADQAWDLVADALSAAGRQDGHGAASGQHLGDDVGLQAAKLGMSERAAQDLAGFGKRVGGQFQRWRIA